MELGFRRWIGRVSSILSPKGRRSLYPPQGDQATDVPIPPDVARLLLRQPLRPLIESLRSFGRGRPGITRETDIYWVVRDRRGRIGGAKADVIDGDFAALDVEIVPKHRRRGHASRLYTAIEEAGIDVEAASDTSLRDGLMTPLGYAFQVGRRRSR